MKTSIISFILIFVVGIIVTQGQQQGILWSLEGRGNYEVGYTADSALYDDTRTGLLKDEIEDKYPECFPTQGRRLTYTIYYPVNKEDVAGKQRPEFVPDYLDPILSDPSQQQQAQQQPDPLKGAYINVPLSDALSSYPVVIFSNGSGGFHHLYTSMLEYVASYGYIVIAMDHEVSNFALDKLNQCVGGIYAQDAGAEVIKIASDNQAIDWEYFMANYDKNDAILKKGDFSQLTAFGHSLGGMSLGAFCQKSSNGCKALVNLDGYDGNINGSWPNNKNLKFMKLAQQAFDSQLQELKEVKDQIGEHHYYVKFENTDHMSFSDLYYFQPNPQVIEASKVVPAISKVILDFFNWSLGQSKDHYGVNVSIENSKIDSFNKNGIFSYLKDNGVEVNTFGEILSFGNCKIAFILMFVFLVI